MTTQAKAIRLDAASADVAVKALLARLLDGGQAAAVLGPFAFGDAPPVPRLVSDPRLLEGLALYHPRFAGNVAIAASRLTRLGPLPQKVVLVARPCEAAAIVELAKLEQIDRKSFIVICSDCSGTQDRKTIEKAAQSGKDRSEMVSQSLAKATLVPEPRHACAICARHGHTEACDIAIAAWAVDPGAIAIPLSDQGAVALEGIHGKPADDATLGRRSAAVESVNKAGSERRKIFLASFASEHGGVEGLQQLLQTCIACRNCSEVCPVCYCKECKFKLEPLETEGTVSLLSAVGRGCAAFPLEPLYYHLGRMTHMAEACVGCGACSEACPNDIPVADLLALAADAVQGCFGMHAGDRIDQARPLSSFQEKELEDLGR